MDPIEIIVRVVISVDGTATRTAEVVNPVVRVDADPAPPKVNVKVMLNRCLRYEIKVGKKEARTCHGCTIGCNEKAIWNGHPVEIKEYKPAN